MAKISAIIPAAGKGSRMQADVNKILLPLKGKPVLARTLQIFEDCPLINEIIIVAAKEEIETISRQVVVPFGFQKVRRIVAGGEERQDSVRLGLAALDSETDWVVVHDGARPLLLLSELVKIINQAYDNKAVIPVVKSKDTIKIINKQGWVISTPDRETVRGVQTPQVFHRGLLERAYQVALEQGFKGTDDASLVEAMGDKVYLYDGNDENIKITTKLDMSLAEVILQEREKSKSPMRTGFGYDVHRLVKGRELILGGVRIDYDFGLLGHSDADVLVHAIMDALLGACALGDIGRHFPDSDERFRGISSMELLAHVSKLVESQGYRPGNIDATIVAQRPKLAPHIEQMCRNIAGILRVEVERINVKATTTEGLGFAGSGDGMAAYAVANLNQA